MNPEKRSEITDYRELLDTLRNGRVNMSITNSGPQHADQLISAIVRSSERELRMFAKNMNGDVHGVKGSTLVDDLRKAVVERGVKVQVLLSDRPEKLSDLLMALVSLREETGKVSIRYAPKPFMDRVIDQFKALNYFTVGDDGMYRRQYDSNQQIAVGNFNDPVTAKQLASLFDSAFQAAA